MKYALDYNRRNKFLHKLDEINVRCDPEELDVLYDYIEEHKHQKINIRIKDENDIYLHNLLDEFSYFQGEHPDFNFAIILPKYDINLANMCIQKELKFFFDLVVRDWETFNTLITAGVSDVYLVEQMMFEIKDAAAAAHKAGVKVRTFPNIAQRRYEETTSLKTFFIRPEDIEHYEGLVDVMELYSIEELNSDVVFKIYSKDKTWFGPLRELIVGLDSDIDGRYIIPRFGERRLNCNRKCFKGQSCDVCDTTYQIAKKLQQVGILIQYDKKKEDELIGKGDSE